MIVDYVDYKAQIRRGGSRVGLVQFSDPEKTRVVFSMGDYTSAWSVNNQINNLRYTKGKYTILIRKRNAKNKNKINTLGFLLLFF